MLVITKTFLAAGIIFSLQYGAFGLWLLQKFSLKINCLEKILLSVALSLAFHSLIFFLLGQLIGPKIYYLSVLTTLIGLAKIRQLFSVIKQLVQTAARHKILTGLAMLAVVSLYSTIAFSWIKVNGDLLFQAGQLHDSVWHIALINQLQQAIPPQHPSDFTLVVTNYHYFYDLIIAAMGKVFSLNVPTLYFQFFPLILSSLLAGSALALGKRLGGLISAAYLLLLTFFAGSFAYFIPLFLPDHSWHDSSFWVSQTFGMMINPQNILTFALTYLVLLLLLFALEKRKKMTVGLQLLLILLITASLGIKSYAFVIFVLLYGSYLLLKLIQLKSWQPFLWGAIFSVTALPFIRLLIDFSSSSFIYEPLWFIDTMVESPDRLNHLIWKFQEDHFRFKGSWYRVWFLKGKQLLIFFTGNLGIRMFALALIPLAAFKKIKLSAIHCLILIGFLFSAVFPLFFIQRGIVWNSIQFWYYALIFANIFTALVFRQIHQQIKNSFNSKLAKNIVLTVFFLVISMLALPTVISVAKIKYFEYERIPQKELELLSTIHSSDRVIIDPRMEQYFQTSLVSALTRVEIVHANPVQLILLGVDSEGKTESLKKMITDSPQQLKSSYPAANKLISNHKLKENTLTLLNQVDERIFVYELKK